MTSNTDQIRQLKNRVHLAGILATLDSTSEGTTKDGIPYISFRGTVQCGEDAIYTVPFRTFVKSKKTDGTDSKNYVKVKEWVKNAVPMTSDKENATKVDMVGSLVDNPYVNANNELVEATQFNVQLFGDFKDYAAELDLEGCILSVTEEIKDDTPTGRGKMVFFTRDIFRNNIVIKNIVISNPDVDPDVNMSTLEDNDYVKGATTTLFINLLPAKKETPAPKKGGIGKQHVTEGNNYLEWVLTGAEDIISDEDKMLTNKIVKAALNERQANLDEIKSKGYQGTKNQTASAETRGSLGGAKKATSTKNTNTSDIDNFTDLEDAPAEEDEEFPF